MRNCIRPACLRIMAKFEFCLPVPDKALPTGQEWIHKIKSDGYRLRMEREESPTDHQGGNDWAARSRAPLRQR
jgi:hypothetical protein